MSEVRVNFSSIVENQVPDFIRTDFPLFNEFLSQYYTSIENKGNSFDLLQNIDQYLKIENLTNLTDSTYLTNNVTIFDQEINVSSVFGFPKQYGLLLIDNEIITYTGLVDDRPEIINDVNIVPQSTRIISPRTEFSWVGKLLIVKDKDGNIITSQKIVSVDDGITLNVENNVFETTDFSGYNSSNLYTCEVNGSKFTGCIRGFSGTTSLKNTDSDQLIFLTSQATEHFLTNSVENLSILFLKEFFFKLKKQVAPGFENESFYGDLNERLFVTRLKDFYSSKGTDCSFEILFRGLYGEDIEVIRPRDYLIQPSDAQYSITKNLVVRALSGDPLELKNRTLYQDQTSFLPEAEGIVTNVERIIRVGKEYYVISLDYGSYATSLKYQKPSEYYDNFAIYPTTRITENIQIGSETISVDSTQGFPESGELIASLPNGTEILISYTSKNLSQFFGCSGITQEIFDKQEIRLNAFAYGYGDNDEMIKVLITGVLSDLEIDDPGFGKTKENGILTKTLGANVINNIRSNNWFFNISPEYEVKNVKRLLDKSDFTYQITFYDDHIFNIGDAITIISSNNDRLSSNVIEYIGKNEVAIRGQGFLDESLKYIIKKNIAKSNSSNYSYINKYNSNVQNVYIDPKDDSVYVASPSLPTYFESPLEVNDRSVTFSGSFNSYELNIGLHGFYTGDSISYYSDDENNRLDLPNGIYFVKKVNETTIKIARSRENIFTNNFIKVTGNVSRNVFYNADFSTTDLKPKLVEPQNIIRKIVNSQNGPTNVETKPGPIGIFVNGVELYNYKSKDNFYYGSLEQIIPIFGGDDYDVINPPIVKITDPVGSGASAFCSVVGSLKRIDVIDGGFNFIEPPIISISGGGGSEAIATVDLVEYTHSSPFKSSSDVDLNNDQIGFSTYHKFKNYEQVIYKSRGQKEVTGLVNGSTYYVSVQDEKTIKLHKSLEDSVVGLNTISLSDLGEGVQYFESFEKKKKIESIFITNEGSNYKNNKIYVSPVGVSTFSDTLTAKNHGFLDGDLVRYSYNFGQITGLSTTNSYYVTKIDNNSFKLSEVASGNIQKDFYFKNKVYVKFENTGEGGEHYFNYEPIEVKIIGRTDIFPIGSQKSDIFDAKIEPIFRGKVASFFIKDGGVSYGSQDIINFNRQPNISLESGSYGSVRPIVSNGKIIDVAIQSFGENYNSPPLLKVNGSGFGAVLSPILENGKIKDVKIISSGDGYGPDTTISVQSSGNGCKIKSRIQSWKINLVEKLIQTQKITADDGILQNGVTDKNSLQYSHAYAPRKLRLLVNGTKYNRGTLVYNSDLQLSSRKEIDSISHSPIIGWAYDGNPIYGPYGFSSPDGGKVKLLNSGYELTISQNRPSLDLYPLGLFVEDYVYNKVGDLDEYNGRFCVTPDYPNGVYAYFCTISPTPAEESGAFFGFKKPIFPYVIGNKFKSTPIDFNFSRSSNQNKIDINKTGWLRNTNPYGLLQKNTKYDYIKSLKDDNKKSSVIKTVSSGSLNSIDIIDGGKDYRVNDTLIFDNKNTGGFGAAAKVSLIEGKKINTIVSSTKTLDDIEFSSNGLPGYFIAHSRDPHELEDGDLISINFKDEYNKISEVRFTANGLFLSSSVESPTNTGLVTHFSVSGNLDSQAIRENDVYFIEKEKIKILSVDQTKSQIKVLRNYNDTVGEAYPISTPLIENPRRFFTTIGISTQKYSFKENREIYINPTESFSLGVGINSDILLSDNKLNTRVSIGTGSTTTIYFNNILDLSNYNRGGYVDIVNSTDSSFNTSRKKIVSIGTSSIQIDFNSSALIGSGVTAYLNNWNFIRIPTKTIYIPNHKLETGIELFYYSNTLDGEISVSDDGINSRILESGSKVYVAKINDDLIGISTVKVGLGSTGSFVGLTSETQNIGTLYFTNFGSGTYHSFRTNYDNTFVGQVNRNTTTITTNENHGLSVGDSIILDLKSKKETTIVVKYSDIHRRVLVNPKTFYGRDVNIDKNTIKIRNHNFYIGQKVLYTSKNNLFGLEDNKIYYVIVVDESNIKLAERYYKATSANPEFIEIGIPGESLNEFEGTISPINPLLNVTKYSSLVFDLSDPSLSYTRGSQIYPAFELNFYTDSQFKSIFKSSSLNNIFDIKTTGVVGNNAKVKFTINEKTPTILFYKLDPIDLKNNSIAKKEIIEDREVLNNNQINLVDSVYSKPYNIQIEGPNLFTFNNSVLPEEDYSISNSTITYYTDSSSSSGKIYGVNITNKGKEYNKIPKIIGVESDTGTGAVLSANSLAIGSIKSTQIQDIGYDYSADLTLRPTSVLAKGVKIDNFYTIDNVGIVSRGKNYYISPDLIVIDRVKNKQINDVKLKYDLSQNNVKIIKNSNRLGKVPPLVIPVDNFNGIGINSISYDSTTKNVIVGLSTGFSFGENFPFKVGDKVLIENTSIGIGSTGRGYNSQNYDYALFTLTEVDENISGNGLITYNLSEYLSEDEFPGVFDFNSSDGIVVPETYLPIFSVTLKPTSFYLGETVRGDNIEGIIEESDFDNGYLNILTIDEINVGDFIRGDSSGSYATISDVVQRKDLIYNVSSNSLVNNGWKKETGFLNNNTQRIPDNDYYQYFSYSIKSSVSFDKWDPYVSKLNHTSGFKKFSDLIIETTNDNVSIDKEQQNGTFESIVDFHRDMNLNCRYDFDIVREKTLNISNKIKSNEIVFNNADLQDYIESIGNRVLEIDDISNLFNDAPRFTVYVDLDKFSYDDFKYKKYYIYCRDKILTTDEQTTFVSLLTDGVNSYLNQYGKLETNYHLGSFDSVIFGNEIVLRFYPTNFRDNDYDLSYISYDIKDYIVGVGTTSLGDVVKIDSYANNLLSGSSSSVKIAEIDSIYRSSKVLVQIGSSTSDAYNVRELTVLHDNTNVQLLEYGELSTNDTPPSVELGTFDAYLSGSKLNIDFTPHSTLPDNYQSNCIAVSIANTSLTGIGTVQFNTGLINSSYTSISSSPTPTSQIIAQYSSNYEGCYCIVNIEDTTNNKYQVSEVLVLSDQNNSLITEYGVVSTSNTPIGIISATTVGSTTRLLFTPVENIDVQVRVFQNAIGLLKTSLNSLSVLDIGDASITSGNAEYFNTNNDLRRSFELTHKNLPIFAREFNAQDSSIVNSETDIIKIPYHYFNTGEELEYRFTDMLDSTSNAISIASTLIGVAVTDKLPSKLYAIKVNDIGIRVAASATEALALNPKHLNITNVGFGTHSFIAKKQNSKVLLTIDNLIQSPVVATATTTTLVNNIETIDRMIKLSNISNFFGADLIKIDDEIIKIASVGVGGTNSISVYRGWLGSGISTHSANSVVTKVVGNYNIVDSTVHFAEAPYGNVDLFNNTLRPDESDYFGFTFNSSFSGRAFLRSGITDSTEETYTYNLIFDQLSEDSLTGLTTEFALKNQLSDVTGISTSNAIILINDILQQPSINYGSFDAYSNYTLVEESGQTKIIFNETSDLNKSDINSSGLPRGGIIISVGSSQGFGYQPLVAAGGTAVVSTSGTIQSISIGSSGSGYRVGIQTAVNVGVQTFSNGIPNIQYVGYATISNGNILSPVIITNPGSGYTSSNPPLVVFDDPLPYTNIPLVYSQSNSGFGTEAVVDIVVGQGSSVINFELKNLGYSYKIGDVLTVSIGGTVGIPTITGSSFDEFYLTVDRVYFDEVFGWSIGDLQILDDISKYFDGDTKIFPISINGNRTSIKSKKGSNIDVEQTIILFINDILQIPGDGYHFRGGSLITLTEAPKPGDTSKLLFYRGTSSVDTLDVDVLETIKLGDELNIESAIRKYDEDDRLALDIVSTDIVKTNLYGGPGINSDPLYERSITWCKQTEDKVINGKKIAKDRVNYEPLVEPTTNIIQPISIASTEIFVQNVKILFDNASEYNELTENVDSQRKITIVSQDNLVGAYATVTVSSAGTITSININEGGVGYTTNPTVKISNPLGYGVTVGIGTTAILQSTLSIGSTISSIDIINSGFGYTYTNPPIVLIESPTITIENSERVTYEGDYGIIVGISTTSVGTAYTALNFYLYIPNNSLLLDKKLNSSPTSVSGIKTGYYFEVFESNVGVGHTSLRSDGSIVAIGSSYIDNVYQVISTEIVNAFVPYVGISSVNCVTVSLDSYNSFTFNFDKAVNFDSDLYTFDSTSLTFDSNIIATRSYGNYSWGKINFKSRKNPKEFKFYNNGYLGITTSAIIKRTTPLKYKNYVE